MAAQWGAATLSWTPANGHRGTHLHVHLALLQQTTNDRLQINNERWRQMIDGTRQTWMGMDEQTEGQINRYLEGGWTQFRCDCPAPKDSCFGGLVARVYLEGQ